jgi:hypothetical protein
LCVGVTCMPVPGGMGLLAQAGQRAQRGATGCWANQVVSTAASFAALAPGLKVESAVRRSVAEVAEEAAMPATPRLVGLMVRLAPAEQSADLERSPVKATGTRPSIIGVKTVFQA